MSENKHGGRSWFAKYIGGGAAERVSAEWVATNFKAWFIERCERYVGRYCTVPVGRREPHDAGDRAVSASFSSAASAAASSASAAASASSAAL